MNMHLDIGGRSVGRAFSFPAREGKTLMKDRAFVRQTLIELLEADTGEKYDDLDEAANLREGLGLDSVDVVSIVSQVERRFHIRLTHEELEKLQTVGDVLDLLVVKLNEPPAAPAGKAAA
jgi:acyl carrier protein